MPPKNKFTKEQIIAEAVKLVRYSGMDALTARNLAQQLGSSAKPIFGLFENMEEVRNAVLTEANMRYVSYLQEDMAKGDYPPYKASGMAYVRFAKEERELFKLLFMRDRSREIIDKERESIQPMLNMIQKSMGCSEEQAIQFHLEMWIVAHGLATMIATAYLQWDTNMVSTVLTDAYMGIRQRFMGEMAHGSDSHSSADEKI